MTKNQLIGLLKFFRNEEYLNQFVSGLLYCNTPETYRMSGEEGISDPYESCVHAYRKSRGDVEAKLLINDQPVEGLTAVTLHMGKRKDMWIHCWLALDMPGSDDELISLTDDINCVRSKFGTQYIFLPSNHLRGYLERVKSLHDGEFEYGRVGYYNDDKEWSVACKSTAYSYQREFRFGFGQCAHLSTEPLQLKYKAGFLDLIQKNPSIRITDTETQAVWFHLDKNECYCNPDS